MSALFRGLLTLLKRDYCLKYLPRSLSANPLAIFLTVRSQWSSPLSAPQEAGRPLFCVTPRERCASGTEVNATSSVPFPFCPTSHRWEQRSVPSRTSRLPTCCATRLATSPSPYPRDGLRSDF